MDCVNEHESNRSRSGSREWQPMDTCGETHIVQVNKSGYVHEAYLFC